VIDTGEVRVLLVGAGVRGRTWSRVVSETPGVRLVGVVDQDPSRASEAADEASPEGPVVATDLTSALREAAPDAVIVATPPSSHHGLVSEALSAGCHVLCEKPVSEDIDEVVDVVQRADRHDLHLLVGMNFRYLSTSQRIRSYADGGQLGALSHAQFSYLRHRDGHRSDLNDYTMRMPNPMLLEQSIHHFDLIRYCYRTEVAALVADSWRPSWSRYDDDCCVSVLFRLGNGARVNYMGTWTASWNKMSFRWRSDFESGALIQRRQFDDLVRVDFRPELGLSGPRFKTGVEAEPLIVEELEPCTAFLDDSRGLLLELVGAIRDREAPVTTARDHLKSLGVVQACVESQETGRWVVLEDFYRKLDIPAALLAPGPLSDRNRAQ
jgi:predicted dehydrogenase